MSKIKKGEWYVLDRNSTLSFVTFEQYADRMDAIARVFPVFFFLVAALVATTTMTRMVDENRLQMGTLKALGYSNASIAGKYLFYALTASVLGSMAGMVVGFVVFPSIIWYAYQLIFSLPTFTLRFYPGMAAASMAISAAVIGLATYLECLPLQPEGKKCSPAAAPGSRGRQAHLPGVHHPSVEAHELLSKDHRPEPVPV